MLKFWFWYLQPLFRNSKLTDLSFQFLPLNVKNSFWKLFFYVKGKEFKRQISQSRITEMCFQISIPKFQHLYIYKSYNFAQNMEALASNKMDFPPKACKNWIGRGGPIFWATPSKFYEKSYLLKINKWWNYGFDISVSFKFRKISVECSVHIYRRPWISAFAKERKVRARNITL